MSADMVFKGMVEDYIGSNLIKEFVNISFWLGFYHGFCSGFISHII